MSPMSQSVPPLKWRPCSLNLASSRRKSSMSILAARCSKKAVSCSTRSTRLTTPHWASGPPARSAPPMPPRRARCVLRFSSSSLISALDRKMAPRVLFFRLKQRRTSPSHSMKLTGGGGFFGSMRTTLESTLGGGRKEFLETFMRWSTLARSWVLIDNRQYISSPGLAHSRCANSRCTMRIAQRKRLGCDRSLKTSGDEIW
mmetsp:Transcript_22401/g.60094  ORF Transcript_22401/g.60094 Transcript_22401/m.60094 type:complete len:201 (-) Transcript_22401:341-943(-)